ncbi:hypothetical protein PINS_up012598 [Pythium insidiosum]|nr:hypothetical protein PINS_up012598 [Pythium insidiosum]
MSSTTCGTFGGNQQPTPFLCLLLKMLQLQQRLRSCKSLSRTASTSTCPVLGRRVSALVGKSLDIYRLLEPMYSDYRKIRKRNVIGWEITHVDEIIDSLLTEEFYMDLALPRLVDREYFEKNGQLPPRRSVLEDELEASDGDGDDDDIDINLDDR